LTPPPLSAGLSERVRQLVQEGKVIDAIRQHREETGKDLATAKAEVDALL
jgi:hypothetical protein